MEKVLERTTTKVVTRKLIKAQTNFWEKLRGLWKSKPVDGLAYQKKMRVRSVAQDEEGECRPEFAEHILKMAQDKSTHVFTSAAEFLKQVRSV